ncbi:MAG TPA: GNAT family protein [Streptosporangiaceae bacterium]|nr:GNAT family protein [Streptosporangiaceae bacterium]
MLRGSKVALRARHETDVPVLEAELHDDVATRSRADARPWRPIPPGSAASPYRVADAGGGADDAAHFSVVELPNDELAGDALLWGIDLHNRLAHIGLSLRPAFRGRRLGADVVRVLCGYGFSVRGLHRLQIETLADNAAMIGAATGAGFVLEGTLRRSAWVLGQFADEVVLGLLDTEWDGG